MIVVVDSSVWISALQFGGAPLTAIEQIALGHRIALCRPIAQEVQTGLIRKFGWTAKEFEDTFAFYCAHPIYAPTAGRLRGVCRDPQDDMVLECAVNAGADVIVTGDKDLLALGEYEGIRILSPRAFLDDLPPLAATDGYSSGFQT